MIKRGAMRLVLLIDAALTEREYVGLHPCVSCSLMRPVSAAEGRCRVCDSNRLFLGLLGGGGTCIGLALGAVAGGWWLGWPGAIAGGVIGAVAGGLLLVRNITRLTGWRRG